MMTSREEMKEAFRLAELYSLGILDTPEEPEFDALVQIASDLLDCPFGTLTLVDSDRQWFKARVGVSVCETPRDISICQHVVKANRPLIIDDLLSDDRVSNSPLVTSAPHLRAYLGVPIQSINKALIGTLCVYDSVPRKWKEHDVNLLTRLTKIAEQLLHKYHTAQPANGSESFSHRDLKAKSEICGVWWSNANSVNVTMSSGLRSLLGLPQKVNIDKVWFSSFATTREALVESSGKTQENKRIINYDYLHPNGSVLKIEETIYYSDLNDMLEYCGVIRLTKDQTNKLPTPLFNSTLLKNTLPAKSNNALEWLASQKAGLIRIDHKELAHIFDSSGDNVENSLPIPWEASFTKRDIVSIRNEIVAARLGLRTNTLFVRNAAKADSSSWLKLEFMDRPHQSNENADIVIQFTQMVEG